MRFSVVIPLFNKGPHVEATIRSALDQAYPLVEVIVVDDGSTDDGLARVRALADARIRIFERSPPGPGGYAARNMGIDHAQGDWIAFLDADDIWMRDHLANLAQAVEKCAEPVGCAFARPVLVQGGERQDYPHAMRWLAPGVALDLRTMLHAWLDAIFCPMWTGAIAFRRDVLIAAGLFPAGRARRGGDKDLWLRCMAIAKSVYVPQVSAEFHQDTVNRVSNMTAHVDLPILTATIRDLLPRVGRQEQRLLRRLSNQEIALYARRTAKGRGRIGSAFLTGLYQPEGIVPFGKVCALMALSTVYRILDARRR